MAKLLKQIRDEGLPDAFSETTQRRQRQAIAFQSASFGPLLQKQTCATSTGEIDLWFQHPLGFLEAASAASPNFAAFLKQVLDSNSNMISVILYSGEVTPSNVLAEHHARRLQAVYWSFFEIGFPGLFNELAWFTISCNRSDT
eukprot:3376494-Pyramimonas_sp.AAC.1